MAVSIAAFAVLTGAAVVLLVGVGSVFAESSVAEGATRGLLEAVAFYVVSLGTEAGIAKDRRLISAVNWSRRLCGKYDGSREANTS